ncbi:MAG: hypothetical protein CVV21_08495 [Candidatus Goldiibacteriota bacterium HGW-Goldbacteria-1]|jgi:parvulin-like peptidyl-prolyl isomerase|nr:MAG: hypothetical protein CVV21_08495 [Candidatus Goldiibacteriota bacterium HGW-Goldbacteria-1]
MKHLFFLIGAVSLLFVSCGTTDSAIKDDQPYKAVSAQEKSAAGQAPSLEESAAKLDAKTVAAIGSYVISEEKYKIMKKYNEDKYEYKLSAEQEKEFLEYVINKKLMAIEARKLGYAEKAEVAAKYEWDFDEILSHAYYTDMVEKKLKITDKEARDYYEKNKEDFVELSAQHMLIKNRDLALNLRKRIASGESFDELTKKYSEDATTKDQGGKLPLFGKGVMVEEFEYAAFMLSPGEVSDPVKTIYGYHLIKVNEKKKISFDDSKEKIIQMVQNNRQKELFNGVITGLKKKYEVRVNENLLK